MATTRTPGITVLADGRRFIDKRYHGVRIGLRAGAITQEQAEERLQTEIARVQCDLARKAHARPTFTDCAARYLAQSRSKRSIDVIKWHVALRQKVEKLLSENYVIAREFPHDRNVHNEGRALPFARPFRLSG